jgi:acyl phosphate:glycerol-3-phosphate acyltransferase
MSYFFGLLIWSYLLGSVPTGLVVAKMLGGPDPRNLGSGNLGTANLYRLMGPKAGLLTLLGDTIKGALPVAVALWWLPPLGLWQETATALVGAAAVLGHVFPLYLGFRGGKGVATTFGVILVLAPMAALSLTLVYAAMIAVTRTFSISALTCAWLLPVAMGLFSASKAYMLLAGGLSGLVLLCHRDNLRRFFRGEEPHL